MRVVRAIGLLAVLVLGVVACTEAPDLPDLSATFLQDAGVASASIVATQGTTLYNGEVSGTINGAVLPARSGLSTASVGVNTAASGSPVSFRINLEGAEVINTSLVYAGDVTIDSPSGGGMVDAAAPLTVSWTGGANADSFSVIVYQSSLSNIEFEKLAIPVSTVSTVIPGGTLSAGISYELLVQGVKLKTVSGGGFSQGSVITAGSAQYSFSTNP